MTDRRALTNRTNATKSTGPATLDGKAIVSQNALRHGLRSQRLLLEDEDPVALSQLQSELYATLRPVGAVEIALAERIVTAIWRQYRIEHAEAATIGMQRRTSAIIEELNRLHGHSECKEATDDALQSVDPDHIEWCHCVTAEIENLEIIDAAAIEKLDSLVAKQAKQDAEEAQQPVYGFLNGYRGGATGYVAHLYQRCQKQILKSQERPEFLALAEQIKATRLILNTRELETLARYQTTLDNQLYKALRAFREAQECRWKTL